MIFQLTSVLLLFMEELLNLLTNITIRDLDIILSFAIIGHQREETIIRDIKLDERY